MAVFLCTRRFDGYYTARPARYSLSGLALYIGFFDGGNRALRRPELLVRLAVQHVLIGDQLNLLVGVAVEKANHHLRLIYGDARKDLVVGAQYKKSRSTRCWGCPHWGQYSN